MDDNSKMELEALDKASENYWKEMDKLDTQTDWSKESELYKQNYAALLLGNLGDDIKKVTSGKEKVKLPLKFKIKRFLEKFFKMF